jgi:hypothetical protein
VGLGLTDQRLPGWLAPPPVGWRSGAAARWLPGTWHLLASSRPLRWLACAVWGLAAVGGARLPGAHAAQPTPLVEAGS